MDIDFLGIGLNFPLELKEETTSYSAKKKKKLAWATYEESIRQSILIILGTMKGERIMRPDFGSDLQQLVFAPNNTHTAAQASYYVEEALEQWEPRIELTSVDVKNSHLDEENMLEITIEYKIIANNTSANLVYPFYLENV